MAKNRREERQIRSSLTLTEKMVARAAQNLLDGDALAAMRILRGAEHFDNLDFRFSTRRRRAIDERSKLEETQRQLKAQAADLAQREEWLRLGEQHLQAERERLKEAERAINALYAQMYAQPPREDGPAPATDEKIDSGVAPI